MGALVCTLRLSVVSFEPELVKAEGLNVVLFTAFACRLPVTPASIVACESALVWTRKLLLLTAAFSTIEVGAVISPETLTDGLSDTHVLAFAVELLPAAIVFELALLLNSARFRLAESVAVVALMVLPAAVVTEGTSITQPLQEAPAFDVTVF